MNSAITRPSDSQYMSKSTKLADYAFTYTRSKAAQAGGLTFSVVWIDTLAAGTCS